MCYRLYIAAALCIAAAAPRAEQNIYGEYWDYELRFDPFLATTSGDYRFDDRVPDVSDAAQRARLTQLREFASRLDAVNASAPGNSLDADILKFVLEHELALQAVDELLDLGMILEAELPGLVAQERLDQQLVEDEVEHGGGPLRIPYAGFQADLFDDAALAARTPEFRERIAAGATLDEVLPEAFAVVREAGRRVLEMRHFDVQLIGGIALPRLSGVLGNPGVFVKTLMLLMSLTLMMPDKRPKDPLRQYLKVKMSLYMITTALSVYNKIHGGEMAEWTARQPDRIYQFTVEADEESQQIAAYLRVKGGRTKAGRGSYRYRRRIT